MIQHSGSEAPQIGTHGRRAAAALPLPITLEDLSRQACARDFGVKILCMIA
jgi:hypothetical protein